MYRASSQKCLKVLTHVLFQFLYFHISAIKYYTDTCIRVSQGEVFLYSLNVRDSCDELRVDEPHYPTTLSNQGIKTHFFSSKEYSSFMQQSGHILTWSIIFPPHKQCQTVIMVVQNECHPTEFWGNNLGINKLSVSTHLSELLGNINVWKILWENT